MQITWVVTDSLSSIQYRLASIEDGGMNPYGELSPTDFDPIASFLPSLLALASAFNILHNYWICFTNSANCGLAMWAFGN